MHWKTERAGWETKPAKEDTLGDVLMFLLFFVLYTTGFLTSLFCAVLPIDFGRFWLNLLLLCLVRAGSYMSRFGVQICVHGRTIMPLSKADGTFSVLSQPNDTVVCRFWGFTLLPIAWKDFRHPGHTGV